MATGKRIKQINNLVIRYTEMYQYAVWSPYDVCLEDRLTLQQAEDYCRNTKDFVSKKQKSDLGPFRVGNAITLLSEMSMGTMVRVQTDKKRVVFVKKDDSKQKSSVWSYKNSVDENVNISAGNLAEIINTKGNSVIGKIMSIDVLY